MRIYIFLYTTDIDSRRIIIYNNISVSEEKNEPFTVAYNKGIYHNNTRSWYTAYTGYITCSVVLLILTFER